MRVTFASLVGRNTFLRGDQNQDYRWLKKTLKSLHKQLVDEIAVGELATVPELISLLETINQCLLRRTIESVEGLRGAWNAGNRLTSVTMARSLIEIAAMVANLRWTMKRAIETGELTPFEQAVAQSFLGARLKKELVPPSLRVEAENILTLIDKLDKNVFTRKKSTIRTVYEILSEVVHPYFLGVLGLYGNTKVKRHSSFSGTRLKEIMVCWERCGGRLGWQL